MPAPRRAAAAAGPGARLADARTRHRAGRSPDASAPARQPPGAATAPPDWRRGPGPTPAATCAAIAGGSGRRPPGSRSGRGYAPWPIPAARRSCPAAARTPLSSVFLQRVVGRAAAPHHVGIGEVSDLATDGGRRAGPAERRIDGLEAGQAGPGQHRIHRAAARSTQPRSGRASQPGRTADGSGARPRLRVLPDRLGFFFNDTATTEIYTLSLHDG